jgi:hypothetical protein
MIEAYRYRESGRKSVTLEEVLNQVRQLSLVDQVRLIEQVASEVGQELTAQPFPQGGYLKLSSNMNRTGRFLSRSDVQKEVSFRRDRINELTSSPILGSMILSPSQYTRLKALLKDRLEDAYKGFFP